MNFFRCLKKNRLFSFIFVSFSVKFSQTALNFKQGAATGGIHFLPHIFISVQEKAKKGCMLCLHGIRLFYQIGRAHV